VNGSNLNKSIQTEKLKISGKFPNSQFENIVEEDNECDYSESEKSLNEESTSLVIRYK